MAVAEGFEPSHGRINSAVPYQLGYATIGLVAGAGVDPARRLETNELYSGVDGGCGDESRTRIISFTRRAL